MDRERSYPIDTGATAPRVSPEGLSLIQAIELIKFQIALLDILRY
jgi:hypothetical protein